MTGGKPAVAVFGAYGHTARFVVDELCRRGYRPILCGRDKARLAAMAQAYPSLPGRQASVDDPASLDRALSGATAVVNCAGPFLDTATPVIEAALRAGIHYLDLAAEQRAVQKVFEHHALDAIRAGVVVLPAMAFYGGLADLLATAAAGDWLAVDAIEAAVALDSWHPTAGTRLTGERNHYPRLVVSQGRLAILPDPPPVRDWRFAGPFGNQALVAMPLSEVITIAHHLPVEELNAFINRSALEDVRDPATPAPVASDASGRSSQQFAMGVQLRRGQALRRAEASGQDIYAVSAPLVVEALERVLAGAVRRTGTVSAGEVFDARDFLAALAPHVAVRFE